MVRKRDVFMGVMAILISASSLAAQAPDTLWTKTYGGSGEDGGYAVIETSGGGYFITGDTKSFALAYGDMAFIKTDASGNVTWQRSYGAGIGKSAVQIPGGYVVAGVYYDNVGLVKLEDGGDTAWTKTFGGDEFDAGECLVKTSDGYVIAGHSRSRGAGVSDVFLVKTDQNGNKQWEKTITGSGNDKAYSIQQTSDGGFIIAGQSESWGQGSPEVFLMKTDGSGNERWTKTYGGSEGRCVLVTADGGFVVTGTSGGSVYLVRTDSEGEEVWSKTYPGSGLDNANCIAEGVGGGYIIVGSSSFDVYIVRVNTSGEVLWESTYGGSGWDIAWSVEASTDGGYIVAGNTSSFGDGGYDIWLLKIGADSGVQEEESERSIQVLGANLFRNETAIRYQLTRGAYVKMAIYDPLGRKVCTLIDNHQSSGTYTTSWDGTDASGKALSSGVYFMRFQADNKCETARMVVVK
jgi:hypothetical protein